MYRDAREQRLGHPHSTVMQDEEVSYFNPLVNRVFHALTCHLVLLSECTSSWISKLNVQRGSVGLASGRSGGQHVPLDSVTGL